jgi:hypothetical protein
MDLPEKAFISKRFGCYPYAKPSAVVLLVEVDVKQHHSTI